MTSLSSRELHRTLAALEEVAIGDYASSVLTGADPGTVHRLLVSALRVSTLRHRLSSRMRDESVTVP